MIVTFNGNRHQESHLADIERLVNEFMRRDWKVVMSDRFLDYLTDRIGPKFAIGIERARLSRPPKADLAIAIGGDGALLKTAAWVADTGIPVAGINTGHLGFLAAFSFDRPAEIEEYLLQGRFTTEARSLLQVDSPCGTYYAVNEAAITRSDPASMVVVETEINSHPSLTYKGDGLIIATPTGSTAYNLSVGGPILGPDCGCWVISPIAAHSLTLRPLVVADSAAIAARVDLRAPHFRVAIDGRMVTMPAGSTLRFSRAPYCLNLVIIPGHTFTDTLRTKLGLGI